MIWNDFLFPMLLLQTQKTRTLPLAIWEYQGQYSMNIPVIMALLALSSLPLIVLYIIGQDKLIKGMMAGAVKG
jgi:raffinose/stachyose/melibiose transport system permease protein